MTVLDLLRWKQRALAVIEACGRGTQNCDACPLVECGDNTSQAKRDFEAALRDRDDARAVAYILAHAYLTDSTPPSAAVRRGMSWIRERRQRRSDDTQKSDRPEGLGRGGGAQ